MLDTYAHLFTYSEAALHHCPSYLCGRFGQPGRQWAVGSYAVATVPDPSQYLEVLPCLVEDSRISDIRVI
jgi:hypothetical protein